MASRNCWIQLEHWASRRQAGALAMSWKLQCIENVSPLPPECGSLPSSLGLSARDDTLANHRIPPSKLLSTMIPEVYPGILVSNEARFVVGKRKQHVIFVCAANVFRSKLAEEAMRDVYGDHVVVRSAGILRPPAGARAENLEDPETAPILRAHGIKPPTGLCRRVERADLEWADHVFVMESWMKKILAERYPKFDSKVELLRRFAQMRGNLNIADDDADAGVFTEKRVMTACRQVYAAVNRIKQLNLL